MIWSPLPKHVLRQRATGDGNMGDVTNPKSICRFGLDEGRWVLVYVKARAFTTYLVSGASSTGTATLGIRLDPFEDNTPRYRWNEVAGWSAFGSDGDDSDIDWRILPEEYARYNYDARDRLVFEWTNPDPVNMLWSLEVGLAYA